MGLGLVDSEQLDGIGLGQHIWEANNNLDFDVAFLNNLDTFQEVNPGIEWDVNETTRALEFA